MVGPFSIQSRRDPKRWCVLSIHEGRAPKSQGHIRASYQREWFNLRSGGRSARRSTPSGTASLSNLFEAIAQSGRRQRLSFWRLEGVSLAERPGIQNAPGGPGGGGVCGSGVDGGIDAGGTGVCPTSGGGAGWEAVAFAGATQAVGMVSAAE